MDGFKVKTRVSFDVRKNLKRGRVKTNVSGNLSDKCKNREGVHGRIRRGESCAYE